MFEDLPLWADVLGYLTWGESSVGVQRGRHPDARNFLSEWSEIIVRDRNHPSIIAWTPFNETWTSNVEQHHRVHIDAYELSKAIDPTRPVNDTSGYVHALTDLWTVHNYARPDKLGALDAGPGQVWTNEAHKAQSCPYAGQPYIVSEFGGLKWVPADRKPHADNTWGYGSDIPDIEAFYQLLKDEVDVILAVPDMVGFCYTQLTDVEQEQNGVYNCDRTAKFDMKRIRAIFGRVPERWAGTGTAGRDNE